MEKLELLKKRAIQPGFALSIGTIIFGTIGITLGIANIVGTAISGAKNIEKAKEIAPEKTLTNSIFTNTYKTHMY